ncbi:MAG: transpeptidase family protein [Alistipes sp.]|nr:transpeptidase family protein [Candidatus Alistipes equi]
MQNLSRTEYDRAIKKINFFYLLFIILTAILCVRIGLVLSSDDNEKRSEKIYKSIIRKETTKALRGTIYDRNHRPLVTSTKRYTIRLDAAAEGCRDSVKFTKEALALCEKLSEFFGDKTPKEYFKKIMDKYAKRYSSSYIEKETLWHKAGFFEKLYHKISKKNSPFDPKRDTIVEKVVRIVNRNHPMVVLCKNIDYDELCIVNKFPIINSSLGSVCIKEESDSRIHPQHDLAISTIGIYDNDHHSGMEFHYRDTLKSTSGYRYTKKIAPGLSIPFSDKDHRTLDAHNGYDIVTTLDADVQDVMTLALKDALKDPGSFRAMSVVMECSTGDILAMASLDKNKGKIGEYTNHILRHIFEPGSTFKIATTIALMDGKKMSPKKTYDSAHGKSVTVGKRSVQDAGDDGGVIDLREALVKSANVYFAKAVFDHYAYDEKGYVEQLKKLHLDETLYLGKLKGSTPRFKTTNSKHWYKHITLVSLSYGYEIEITPLHLVMLYNAMANNGKMMAPRLIQRIEKEDSIISQNPPRVLEEQICSKATREFFTEALEEAALEGTGKYYFGRDITPYRVAAKTGTAQYSQHKMKNTYVGSMVMFFPADNPKYTIYTAVIKTKQWAGDTYYGATLSGPINQKIASYLYSRDIRTNMFSAHGESELKIKGGLSTNLSSVMKNFGLTEGVWEAKEFGTFDINTMSAQNVEVTDSIMPRLLGMGMKDAVYLAEKIGLHVTCNGMGCVIKQSIPEGTEIKPEQNIVLTFGRAPSVNTPTK